METIFPGICGLGECPVWHAPVGRLVWTDHPGSRLWAYDPETGRSEIFWQGDLHVGGFAFTRAGGLVLCTDRGVFSIAPEDAGNPVARPVRLFDLALAPGERFNDVTVDPSGRLFAGTLYEDGRPDGILYRIERGRPPVPVLRGLLCTNGMTFSLDERTFFHTDSTTRTITRYTYDRATGGISDPHPFFRWADDAAVPDGITLDGEDRLWVAMWGGSCVLRLDADGSVLRKVDVPAIQASSVMFGGPRLDALYVTSAAEGADDPATGRNRDGSLQGGPLFQLDPGVAGRAEWLADL